MISSGILRRLAGASVAVTLGVGTIGFGVLAGARAAGAVIFGHVAGYSEVASSNPTQTATTRFVVPRVSCAGVPLTGFQAVLAGVRLDTTSGDTTSGVELECAPTPVYRATMQVNGAPVPVDVAAHPGDTVTATATESATSTAVTVNDMGDTQTAYGTGSTVTAEDVGDTALSCSGPPCDPVPRTHSSTYSGASINGLPLTGASQGYIVDASSVIEVRSGPLFAGGHNFTVTWRSSCGTSGTC